MSEIPQPQPDKRNAQKFDLKALADAYEALGDHEQAQKLREQAQKQPGKKSQREWVEQKLQEEHRQREKAAQNLVQRPDPEQKNAEKLDLKALADALEQQGRHEEAKYFRQQT